MIIDRLLIMISFTVLHTMAKNLIENSNISREEIHVNVGKRVRMECELNNSAINESEKGLWLRLEDAEVFFYSTSRIHLDERFQIEQRTSLRMINETLSDEIIIYSLIIDDIRLSDSGTYSCQSDNKIIKFFSLNIVERPYFITHEYSTSFRTQIGRNLSMNCRAQGKPIPNLSWIKKIDENNQEIMLNCSTLSPSCQLNLLHVTRWHHGIYECVARNIIGTIGRFYEVDVQFPPDVSSLSERLFHFIGDTVTLQCLIDTNPEADIRWYHRFSDDINDEMDLSRQFSEENFDQNENKIWYIKHEQFNATRWQTSLFIKHIPRRFFNSKFICRARNRYGTAEQTIIVTEKYHHTTPSNESSFISTTQLISTNRSARISSYLFLFELLFSFVI